MYNEFNDDEYEYYSEYEEDIFYSSDLEPYVEPGLYPDPLLIAAVTCVFCLLIFGVLTKLTVYVFGSVAVGSLSTHASDQKTGSITQNGIATSDGECRVSTQYPQKITRWCDLITKYSTEHSLDPDLIAALIWLESGGNELAYSRSGAVGLMQIMPSDGIAAGFYCVNGPCFKDRPSSDQLRDPEFNIAFGTRYLSSLIRKNDNLREALKSYGPMDAGYSYSDKVLSIFNRYKNN